VNHLSNTQKRLGGLLFKRPGLAFALCGPPGIGKTFTVQWLLLETPCATISLHANGSAVNLAKTLPRPKKVSAWVDRILEKVAAGTVVETQTLVPALGAILSGLAPFVVHLEDVHELEDDQLGFVQALALAVQGIKGVGLIVTSRSPLPQPFELVPLEALSFSAVRSMLEAEAGANLPLECLALIHSRAAGNPLFTLEFFRFLARRGFVWNDGTRWHWRAPEHDVLPGTIEAVIERVIAEVCADLSTQTTLEARAYLESVIPNWPGTNDARLALLACIAGLEPEACSSAEHRLLTRGVLNEHGFVHPLFREVPVKNLALQTRELFAGRALAFIADPLLATLFIKDAALDKGESRGLLTKAIAHAEALNQRQVVVDLTTMALELDLYDPLEQCRLGLRLARYSLTKAAALFERIDPQSSEDVYGWADILAQLGRLQDAQKLLQTLSASEREQPGWLEHLAMVHGGANDHAGALLLWDAHPTLRDARDPKLLLSIAQSLTSVGRMPEAGPVLELALHWLQSQAEGEDSLLADLLTAKGNLAAYTGDTELATRCGNEALQIYERLEDKQGQAAVFHGQGIDEYYRGAYAAAVQNLGKAKQLFFEAGNRSRFLQSLTMLSATQTELGLYEQAESGLLEVEEQLRSTPSNALVNVCTNLSFLYRGWNVTFGPMLALKYARMALTVAEGLNNPRLKTNCLYHLSKSETLSGNPQLGLTLADQTLALAGELQYPAMLAYPHHARFEALKAMGQLPEALEALRIAERMLRSDDGSADADFYALELACLQETWGAARKQLKRMQDRGIVHFSNIALRLYPQLRTQSELALERAAEPTSALETERNLETKSETKSKPNSQTKRAQKIGTASHTEPQLQVLGSMQIRHKRQSQTIRGRKRQQLLACLLEARMAGRKEVHRLELLDAIYPEGYEEQATSSLKELVRSLRANFGGDTIITTINGYALGTISSDAERFLQDPQLQLWRGPYLEGLRIESSNEIVHETLHLALFNHAKTQLETDPELSLQASEILMASDAFDLNHLELQIRAMQTSGNQKSLARLYAKSSTRLLEVGEHLPTTWQAFLQSRAIGSTAMTTLESGRPAKRTAQKRPKT
jgi:Tetratricopeptide repeat